MMSDVSANQWRSQSAVTQVGSFGAAVDAVPSDVRGLRQVSQQLVTHYMGFDDEPITGERLEEADLRYVDAMLARLLQLGEPRLARDRPVSERIAGCCRDFTVLFVAMARHKGIPARARVGFANYFQPGWYLDHVIAEVWDAPRQRWRLVEPEIADSFVPAGDPFDPLDVPRDRFVTGPRAWLAARSGQLEVGRFAVDPSLDIPYTRGWLSLRHHVVQDLAALNKAEMLVWDQWGILNEDDPLQHADMLDSLAHAIAEPDCPVATLSSWAQQEGIAVPRIVTSYSPSYPDPLHVDVSRTLDGMLKA